MRKDRFGSPNAEQKKPRRNRRDRRRNVIEGEQIRRGYQPLEERTEEEQEAQQSEIFEDTEQESEGENQVIRGDNFPLVDSKAYITEGKKSSVYK